MIVFHKSQFFLCYRAHFLGFQTFLLVHSWFILCHLKFCCNQIDIHCLIGQLWFDCFSKSFLIKTAKFFWHPSTRDDDLNGWCECTKGCPPVCKDSNFSKDCDSITLFLFNDLSKPMVIIELKLGPIWLNVGDCLFRMVWIFKRCA